MIKIVKCNAEVNSYDGKFSEVFCNQNLCGYIVKINDSRYHAITSDDEQYKTFDNIDSAIKGLLIQYLKKTGKLKYTPDLTLTSEDKEKLESALKGLFENMFGECECPECQKEREGYSVH
ncbi:TPA: hypothetical protein ACWV7L_003299 [Salmonella enterica subsp. enterica serovar Muenchen]